MRMRGFHLGCRKGWPLVVVAVAWLAGCADDVPSEDEDAGVQDASAIHDASAPDANAADANADGGPARASAAGLSAGGRRSTSPHFTMFSIIGQPTPSGAGPMQSTHFRGALGLEGEKR